jgi:STE24 endopeptidase
VLIAFGSASTAVGLFLASLAMRWAVSAFEFSGVADVAALPALAAVLGLYGLATLPLDNAVSRWREGMADQYALRATGKSQAFASAFVRLANQNLAEVDPEKWVVWLFYSHPPLEQRIETAREWKAAAGRST